MLIVFQATEVDLFLKLGNISPGKLEMVLILVKC